MRTPATEILSTDGSTRMPWTVTGRPFTLIRPASIMSSQTRREPTPARARTVCSRPPPCGAASAAGGDILQPLPLPVAIGVGGLAIARVDGGELHVLGPAVAG